MADKEIIRPPFESEFPQVKPAGFRFFQQIADKINNVIARITSIEANPEGYTTDHAGLTNLPFATSGHTGFEAAKGTDDNYVTDAQKTVIGSLEIIAGDLYVTM